jgi:hypothetical protein
MEEELLNQDNLIKRNLDSEINLLKKDNDGLKSEISEVKELLKQIASKPQTIQPQPQQDPFSQMKSMFGAMKEMRNYETSVRNEYTGIVNAVKQEVLSEAGESIPDDEFGGMGGAFMKIIADKLINSNPQQAQQASQAIKGTTEGTMTKQTQFKDFDKSEYLPDNEAKQHILIEVDKDPRYRKAIKSGLVSIEQLSNIIHEHAKKEGLKVNQSVIDDVYNEIKKGEDDETKKNKE